EYQKNFGDGLLGVLFPELSEEEKVLAIDRHRYNKRKLTGLFATRQYLLVLCSFGEHLFTRVIEISLSPNFFSRPAVSGPFPLTWTLLLNRGEGTCIQETAAFVPSEQSADARCVYGSKRIMLVFVNDLGKPLLLNLQWSQAFHLTSLQMELRHPYNHRRFVETGTLPFLPQDPTWSLVVHNRLTFRVFQKRTKSFHITRSTMSSAGRTQVILANNTTLFVYKRAQTPPSCNSNKQPGDPLKPMSLPSQI
ncbi:hypothetical protein EVAR_70991_1, partial [Eumeta japonica]